MFRIRRIYDGALPVNRVAIAQIQEILRAQFPALSPEEVTEIPERLANPMKFGFRSYLFVAERNAQRIDGFAMLFFEPELRICYLDFVAAGKQMTGRGVGGALYERVRQEAHELGCIGVFFECLPDDPALSRDPAIRRQNVARLRFYEQYGARPIAGTAYETPVRPGDDNPPFLVFDDLGSGRPLRRAAAQQIVRTILDRKYGRVCPKAYIERVVASFVDDPVRMRPPRYLKAAVAPAPAEVVPPEERIALVVNDKHAIHHVRERGYVESPIRVDRILRELDGQSVFERLAVRHYGETHIRAVHAHDFVDYLRRICAGIPPQKSVYPYVFPIRNAARPPTELAGRAGYYCIDTFTPLNANAWLAAVRAVDCALTAADEVLRGRRLAYALVRPPGHHAERRVFGGFCYLNSNAIAAHYLSRHGKVAILDIDYHHGNGQQDVFYERDDVFTVSLHGHPRFAYPYFSGFEEERGEGRGRGYCLNLPLPETLDGPRYHEALDRALRAVQRFGPDVLVVALGLDTARGDPTGTWTLEARDFEENGRRVGALGLPTLVVQEGGYNTRNLGINARRFFLGLRAGAFGKRAPAGTGKG